MRDRIPTQAEREKLIYIEEKITSIYNKGTRHIRVSYIDYDLPLKIELSLLLPVDDLSLEYITFHGQRSPLDVNASCIFAPTLSF